MKLLVLSSSPRISRRGTAFVTILWLAGAMCAYSGNFKRIAIDGNFDDWIGVPISMDDVVDDTDFDFQDVSIANDEEFIYVRARLHSPGDYGNFHHQVVVDGDGDSFTGLAWLGLGSEMMIEDGAGYQQKNGEFNEGGVSQLGWAAAPLGTVSQFEARISRDTVDTDGERVITGDSIFLSFVARNLDWQITDSLEGVAYELAETPDRFEGTEAVIEFQDASWVYQETNDPGLDWTMPGFSPDGTWARGEGFLGFGLEGGVYPAVTAPLVPGRNTYYLRTSFDWNFDNLGVALLIDIHLSDGAVIYMNGRELRRVRMPSGAVSSATPATGAPETPGAIETFSLPSTALSVGRNHLAIEVHQAPGSEDELAFGLSLRATDRDPPSQLDPTQPEDREVVEGQVTVFSPGALAGTGPFDFQWYRNAEPIEGAIGEVLEFPVVLAEDAATYSVEISNASGTVRSRGAALTTSAEPVTLVNTAEPADREVVEGESTTFEARVTGSPPLAYQWYKDDVPIDGETGEAYTIAAVAAADAGTYHLAVTNRVNTVASRRAQLAVLPDSEAPAVESVTGASGKIVLLFSEPVDEATALAPASYALPGIAINGAELSEDRRTVTLFTGAFSFGQAVPLRINGVEDRFGNRAVIPVPFRATILVDGEFDDWQGIAPAASDPEEIGEGGEFKDFRVANDGDYLYLRFSFHTEIGPLPGSHFYQIYFDADHDPETGFQVAGIGSSMMIENGLGWLQRDGGFNEGSVGNTGFQLAPPFASSEYECRISLDSLVNADQSPIFTGDSVAVAFSLLNTSWSSVDIGPIEDIIVHTFTEWLPPTPAAAFEITAFTHDPTTATVTVTWAAAEGGRYAVEMSADLNLWEELDDGIGGNGQPQVSYSFDVPATTREIFVRVRRDP